MKYIVLSTDERNGDVYASGVWSSYEIAEAALAEAEHDQREADRDTYTNTVVPLRGGPDAA